MVRYVAKHSLRPGASARLYLAMRTLLASVLLLAACGASKENKEVCKKAGDRYLTCVGEILGPELQGMAAKNDGTAMCARDDKTVAMYKKCLPSPTCSEFMDCITDYAEGTAPKVASDKPRAEQCKQHVEQGIRGIANQIMMLGDVTKRDDASKRKSQECLFDEKRPWQDCLEAPELKEADGYAKQRMEDCLAWDDARAACELKLPGRSPDCEELDMWEAPIAKGPAGPSIDWQSTLTDADDYGDEAHLAWGANKTLIVRDDTGLRGLRDGKEAWKLALGDEVEDDFALVGNFIVIRENGEKRALHVIDAKTGAQIGVALPGIALERHGAAGTKIVVQTDDDQLFEIDPSKCKGTKPGKACATRLGQLNTDDSVYTTRMTQVGDVVVMTSGEGYHVVDRTAATLAAVSEDDFDAIVPTTSGVATVKSGTVELRDFAGCPKREGCVRARQKSGWVATIDPTALIGGAIAFNDHAIMEKTTLLEADGTTWSVNTHGHGGVAGDGERIYTVALGRDAKEPARLLALSRTTGAVEWQTELPGASYEAREVSVTLGEKTIAVRVDGTLYVLSTATKT